jgi:adenosine deaminase
MFSLDSIPKVELHRHLECSLRLSTLMELAPHVGIEVPATENEIKRRWLVTEPMRDLEAVLKKFMTTQAVLDSEEILERITYEVIEDASRENVRILELRYAPTFIRHGHEHLSFEKIHQAIVKGVQRAAKTLPIAVGLIAIIQRTLPLNEAARVTDFAIDNRDTFLALDLADNEEGFEPTPFAPLFEKARASGLHVTVHSGESDLPLASEYVRTAIERLGAERIGHGVQIHKSPEMIEFVKKRKIPLELCPTSNWLTNAVPSTAAHPFRKLMEAGVPVTINSDDPGVFAIDLTNEYRVLRDEQRLSIAEFEKCNDTAAANSFLPYDVKQKFWPRPIDKSLAAWTQ